MVLGQLLQWVLITSCLLSLAGCHLGPRYHYPVVDTPTTWKTPQEQEVTATEQIEFWWEIFHDEKLNALEKQGIEKSPNLQVALERLAEARAVANVDKAALYPQANLDPSYNNTGQLFKFYAPPGLGQLLPPTIPDIYRVHILQYRLPVNVNYELDLWGKLRGQYDSALLSAQAKHEAYFTALLTLTTDIANTYFQLQTLDTMINLLQEKIDVLKTTLELDESRYAKGLVDYTQVLNASLQLTNIESSYYETVRLRQLQENLLAVLLGVPSSDFKIETTALADNPPVIPAGLPSEILLRRPDIAEAERNMAAQHALIGVAYASFFPSLNLTSALGYFSPISKDFLTWQSRLWTWGANIAQVIFDGGRNSANLQATLARFRATSKTYEQQVLTAFKEVEDALSNLEMYDKQFESLWLSTEAAIETTQLCMERNTTGLVNYLEVTNNLNSQLNAELTKTAVLGMRFQSTIQLIKALGGSWNSQSIPNADEKTTSTPP